MFYGILQLHMEKVLGNRHHPIPQHCTFDRLGTYLVHHMHFGYRHHHICMRIEGETLLLVFVISVCRMLAMLTYRSGPEWQVRFGRKRVSDEMPSMCPDFEIESYLDHQVG